MIEIVKNNNFDFDNYEYAICECTSWDEGIQFPRKEDNYFASFNCPRCGKELGLFVRRRNIKNDPIYGGAFIRRKRVQEGALGMTVKDLITRLLDEPMDAEIQLQTDYDKPVESYLNNVRCVTRGVIFNIDSIEHWASNRILINFTDWRKETQDGYDRSDKHTC